MKTKTEIIDILSKSDAVIKSYGVERIGLFGSFLRGEQMSDSDVDLLVEFQHGMKTYDNFIRLVFYLEELLGQPVELVTIDSLSPYIGPRILAEVEYVS
jgi:predicted nucleotidyltransferase